MVGGEKSALLHFKALRSVLAQASEQNACPAGLPVQAQAKINPAIILHESHTTHIWSSKDKAQIKRQRERMRKREFLLADL